MTILLSEAVLLFLLSKGCVPTDNIQHNPNLKGPGHYENGIVYFRDQIPKEDVQVHELYHSCQHGADRRMNEVEAKEMELLWRESFKPKEK